MKKFTFVTPFGVFSSENSSLSEAFKALCVKDSRITMSAINGGSIQHLNDKPKSNIVFLCNAA